MNGFMACKRIVAIVRITFFHFSFSIVSSYQHLFVPNERRPTSRSVSLPRSTCGRTTGLRGQLLSQEEQDFLTCSSRVSTGRMTGLRGQLCSQGQESLSCSSDSQLLVFSDSPDLPRLNTAVSAQMSWTYPNHMRASIYSHTFR